MKNLAFFFVCLTQLLGSDLNEISVMVFSEVRIEKNDPGSPEGVMVEYGYKPEGNYVSQNKTEALTIKGIAQLQTFNSGEQVHPFVGKPFYLVVLDRGKMCGSVIKCYTGDGSGFYLIKGLKLDVDGSLKKVPDDLGVIPLSSLPLCKVLRIIIDRVTSD